MKNGFDKECLENDSWKTLESYTIFYLMDLEINIYNKENDIFTTFRVIYSS